VSFRQPFLEIAVAQLPKGYYFDAVVNLRPYTSQGTLRLGLGSILLDRSYDARLQLAILPVPKDPDIRSTSALFSLDTTLLVCLSFLLHAACPFFLESGADDLSEDTSFLRAVASSEIRNRQRLRTPLFKECAGILP
jgi:hypothetical protein